MTTRHMEHFRALIQEAIERVTRPHSQECAELLARSMGDVAWPALPLRYRRRYFPRVRMTEDRATNQVTFYLAAYDAHAQAVIDLAVLYQRLELEPETEGFCN